jgi:hypothetical protein
MINADQMGIIVLSLPQIADEVRGSGGLGRICRQRVELQ